MQRLRSQSPTGAPLTIVRAALTALLAAFSLNAVAQEAPLAGLLPGSTVVAVHMSELDVPSGLWNGALQTAGYPDVRPLLERLLMLAGHSASEALGLGHELDALSMELEAELAAACPELAEYVAALDHTASRGSAVIGVSMSRFNPLPGVVLVYRPADPEAIAEIYRDLVYCFASEVSLDQDGVPLDVFADGSDQPLIAALVDGDVVVATNVDLARAVVRLAGGSNEPSHLRTPVGRLASNMMQGGVGFTFDMAALADALEGLVGMIPAGDDAGALVSKALASLRTVSGMAVNATFDQGGLLLTSVVTVDDDFGESELAALVLGSGSHLDPPALVPRGASVLSVGRTALPESFAWVDAWLAAAAPVIGENLDLRSLADRYLELDLDAALLAWVGGSWHMAELEVPGTDLLSYLVGMEGVFTMPVTSEEAARAGVTEWIRLAESALNGSLPLISALDDLDLPTDDGLGDPFDDPFRESFAGELGWDDMVSVKQETYRGVGYERWRVGPLTDLGMGIFGGHLVLANPAATMSKVIDVYLGASSVTSDPNIGHLVASQSPGQHNYEIVDLPRYLRGFAAIADAAAAPAATGVRAVALEAVASGELSIDESELPTFAELVTLGDFVSDLLEALAARTGVAVGGSERVGDAVWWTFRIPLR